MGWGDGMGEWCGDSQDTKVYGRYVKCILKNNSCRVNL